MLSLSLPDVCGDSSKCSTDRYIEWINKNMKKELSFPLLPDDRSDNMLQYGKIVPGYVIYKLRCKFFHEGNLNVEYTEKYGNGNIIKYQKYEHSFDVSLSFNTKEKAVLTSYGRLTDSHSKKEIIDYTINVPSLCKALCSKASKSIKKDDNIIKRSRIKTLNF